MPRKSTASQKVTRTPFRVEASQARTTSGNSWGQLNLILTSMGARAYTIGTAFEWFRISKLRVYSFIAGNNFAAGGGAWHAVSFINTPSGSQTTPTTAAMMSQHEHYKAGPMYQIVGFTAGKKDLLSEPLQWFNTYSTGSIPATMLSAGVVTYQLTMDVSGTVSSTYQQVVIEGELEFHTPIDPADSFLLRIPSAVRDDPHVVKALTKARDAVEEATSTN